MQRPLVLSACSAVLLLVVSAAAGQAQEEKDLSSATENTLDEQVEKTMEEEGKEEKTQRETGHFDVVLLKKVRPKIKREARSRLIRMNPQPSPTPEPEAFLHIPKNKQDPLLRVRELMSRLSSLLLAQAPQSSLNIATPAVAEESFAAPPSAFPMQEPAASALAAVSDSASAAVHSESTPSAGTTPPIQTPAAALEFQPPKTQVEGPQTVMIRGAAAGGGWPLPRDPPTDWSAVHTFPEMENPALGPIFAHSGTDNLADAASVATYTSIMKMMEALDEMKNWIQLRLTNLVTSAGGMFKGVESSGEEAGSNEMSPLERLQKFSERNGFLPFLWVSSST